MKVIKRDRGIKFYLQVIFYTLVGIFYRKDIRITYYYFDEYNTRVTLIRPSENMLSESSQQAYNRLIDKSHSQISTKDRLNVNRLKLGKNIGPQWKFTGRYYIIRKFKSKWVNTFLCDLAIREKDELVYNSYNPIFFTLLNLIKRNTDYSNQHNVTNEYKENE